MFLYYQNCCLWNSHFALKLSIRETTATSSHHIIVIYKDKSFHKSHQSYILLKWDDSSNILKFTPSPFPPYSIYIQILQSALQK